MSDAEELGRLVAFVRSVAMNLPPSDFGSDRAIKAMAHAMLAALPAMGWHKVGPRECVVPKAALDWLMGCGEGSFEKPANVKGSFWWRSEFQRRCALLAAAAQPEEESR